MNSSRTAEQHIILHNDGINSVLAFLVFSELLSLRPMNTIFKKQLRPLFRLYVQF